MIGLIFSPILMLVAVAALRREGIRWRFAVPFGLIPASFALFGGIIGILLGAFVSGAYFKIKMPA